jgi:hypothetical protein
MKYWLDLNSTGLPLMYDIPAGTRAHVVGDEGQNIISVKALQVTVPTFTLAYETGNPRDVAPFFRASIAERVRAIENFDEFPNELRPNQIIIVVTEMPFCKVGGGTLVSFTKASTGITTHMDRWEMTCGILGLWVPAPYGEPEMIYYDTPTDVPDQWTPEAPALVAKAVFPWVPWLR